MANHNLLEKITDPDGKLKLWPTKRAKQIIVLQYLANKFDFECKYTEKEVNQILNKWHKFEDHALLRRELIEVKYLSRTEDGGQYWKVANDCD